MSNEISNDKGYAAMTAYASNTRMASPQASVGQGRWSEKIQRLITADYAFTGLCYADGGLLFRGMSSGLAAGLRGGSLGLFEDGNPHARLEQQLAVYFVSQDLSDAITCARLWEDVDDAGVLVLDTRVFNAAYAAGDAAMMQFAEPGVVFDYPLFTNPFSVEQIHSIFVNATTYETLSTMQLIAAHPTLDIVRVAAGDRASIERLINDRLVADKAGKAVTVKTEDYPGRRS